MRAVGLPLLVFLASSALYAATLLPDVLPADSGEFQFVATIAGVAHPPGYPLHTMLGWLFSRLPLGATPAWRVNLLSAITAALTLALVFRTACKLTGSVWGGITAALTLGSATTFWATATKASIRPLTAFFMALCLYALTEYVTYGRQDRSRPGSAGNPHLILLAAGLSLGLTHHPSLAFPGLVFVLYLVAVDPTLIRSPRRWLKPIAAFGLGLLILIYLPLRGGKELTTLTGFLDHVLARGFHGDMFALGLVDRLVLLPTLFRFQFNGFLLLGMLFGAALTLWRDPKLALLLIGTVLVHTAVTLTYDAPQTLEYEMPAYVSLALLIAVPFGENIEFRSRTSRLGRTVSAVQHLISLILLVAAVVNLADHLPSFRTLSHSRDTRDYVETVLRGAPENAVVLANWHWFTPMRYLQQLEELRPDLTIEYVAPRGEPLAQTWARRIEEHISQRPVLVSRFFKHTYRDLPYQFEPLGEAFLVRREPRLELPAEMQSLDITLGEQITLLGYQLETKNVEPTQPVEMTLAWTPVTTPTTDIALFAQMIGSDGKLWSVAEDPRHSHDQLEVGQVVVDRFVLYPLLQALPGEYALLAGAYSNDGRLVAVDGSDAIQLDLLNLHPSTRSPVTRYPHLANFVHGPTLIGVDYDTQRADQVRAYVHWAGPGPPSNFELLDSQGAEVGQGRIPTLEKGDYATVAVDLLSLGSAEEIRQPASLTWLSTWSITLDGNRSRRWNLLFRGPVPVLSPYPGGRYVPLGDAAVLTGHDGPTGNLQREIEVRLGLHFLARHPLDRDYITATALTGINPDGSWAWRDTHDTVPALGAVPTLKWIRGSTVFDPHRMTIPADAPSVPVVGSLVVYDHFTQRQLPNLDDRLDSSVPLGTWELSSQ